MVKVKIVSKDRWHINAELIDANPKLPETIKKYFAGVDTSISMKKRMEINSKIKNKIEAKEKRE